MTISVGRYGRVIVKAPRRDWYRRMVSPRYRRLTDAFDEIYGPGGGAHLLGSEKTDTQLRAEAEAWRAYGDESYAHFLETWVVERKKEGRV